MSKRNVVAAGGETRQSLIRVWLVISAVWVAFWLMIATTMLAASGRGPFAEELSLFSLIVLAPPFFLLAIGASARLLFEALSHRAGA